MSMALVAPPSPTSVITASDDDDICGPFLSRRENNRQEQKDALLPQVNITTKRKEVRSNQRLRISEIKNEKALPGRNKNIPEEKLRNSLSDEDAGETLETLSVRHVCSSGLPPRAPTHRRHKSDLENARSRHPSASHRRHHSADGVASPQNAKESYGGLKDTYASPLVQDEERTLINTLQRRQSKYGNGHSKVALSWNCIGNFHFQRGNYALALESYMEALVSYQIALGDEHPFVASTIGNIGTVQWRLGAYDLAAGTLEKACSILKKTLGTKDLATGNALHNLGQVLCLKGDNTEAMNALKEALTIRKTQLGNKHIDVARVLSTMGTVQGQIGMTNSAIKLHQESLRIKKKSLGQQHPSVLMSMSEIARLLQKSGMHSNAIAMYKDALRSQRVRCSQDGCSLNDYKDLGDTLHAVGMAYIMIGQVPSAKKALNEAKMMYKRAGLADGDRSLTTLQNNINHVNAQWSRTTHSDIRTRHMNNCKI